MSCAALMAFQIISTNDVPEIMFGLMADYKGGKDGWYIIVQLYFITSYVVVNIVCLQMVTAVIIEVRVFGLILTNYFRNTDLCLRL